MLAPDQNFVQQLLAGFLDSYQSTSLSAISLRNSSFFPLSPTPQWMVDLQTNLTGAQTIANNWLTTQGPTVVSQIPQYFINYSNGINTVAAQIANTTDPQIAIKHITWLKQRIDAIPAAVADTTAILNAVANNFTPYNEKINSALEQANKEIVTDQAAVKDISDKISKLLQDISAETVKASGGMTGVITSGASLSFALLSWSFAVATTLNPAIPIIGIAVAIGGITYGAITNAINEAKVVDQLKQIKELNNSLLEENQAIAVLQALTPMLQNISSSLDSIKTSINMSAVWQAESQKLTDLLTTLQNYQGSIKSIPDIASIQQAATTWKTIAAWCTEIQKFSSGLIAIGDVNLDPPTQLTIAR